MVTVGILYDISIDTSLWVYGDVPPESIRIYNGDCTIEGDIFENGSSFPLHRDFIITTKSTCTLRIIGNHEAYLIPNESFCISAINPPDSFPASMCTRFPDSIVISWLRKLKLPVVIVDLNPDTSIFTAHRCIGVVYHTPEKVRQWSSCVEKRASIINVCSHLVGIVRGIKKDNKCAVILNFKLENNYTSAVEAMEIMRMFEVVSIVVSDNDTVYYEVKKHCKLECKRIHWPRLLCKNNHNLTNLNGFYPTSIYRPYNIPPLSCLPIGYSRRLSKSSYHLDQKNHPEEGKIYGLLPHDTVFTDKNKTLGVVAHVLYNQGKFKLIDGYVSDKCEVRIVENSGMCLICHFSSKLK